MTRFRGKSPRVLAFGTSGLRGLVTGITNLETYINTRGFLDYLDIEKGSVALAGDLRPGTERILRAVRHAIEDAGLAVDYLGKIPTPALMYYALENAQPSVMVTGSHMPFDRNGIKFGKPTGEVLKDDETEILEVVASVREAEYRRCPEDSAFDDDAMLKESLTLPVVTAEGGGFVHSTLPRLLLPRRSHWQAHHRVSALRRRPRDSRRDPHPPRSARGA